MSTSQTNLLFPHLFEGHKIHCFWLDGQPAFLAHEVGAALGISEPRKSIRRSNKLEEGVDYVICAPKDLSTEVQSVIEGELSSLSVDKKASTGMQNTFYELSKAPNRLIVLLESGLYTFVLRSDKPEAIECQRWLVEEVLPALRKQGFYGVN